jgi:hypothetical protein
VPPGALREACDIGGVEGKEQQQRDQEEQVRENGQGAAQDLCRELDHLADVEGTGDRVDLGATDTTRCQPVPESGDRVVDLRGVRRHELGELTDGDTRARVSSTISVYAANSTTSDAAHTGIRRSSIAAQRVEHEREREGQHDRSHDPGGRPEPGHDDHDRCGADQQGRRA